MDLVVAVSAGGGQIETWRDTGDGWFELLASYPVAVPGQNLVAGDFDGDGHADVASGAGILEVYLGDGTGALQPLFGVSLSWGSAFAAVDVDVDGATDLVGYVGDVRVALSNGDGTFQSETSYPFGAIGMPALVDLNHDGPPDLVVPVSGGVGVALGSIGGTFGALSPHPIGADPDWVATGDFDGDGDADALALSSAGVDVLLGGGDGTLAAPVRTVLAPA